MSMFRNSPMVRNEDGEQKIKRYVHSPLTVEHNGVNASITEHGRVIFSKVAGTVKDSSTGKETIEYDEIEIPASLIFKMASLLKATRKVKFVSISEIGKIETTDSE